MLAAAADRNHHLTDPLDEEEETLLFVLSLSPLSGSGLSGYSSGRWTSRYLLLEEIPLRIISRLDASVKESR